MTQPRTSTLKVMRFQNVNAHQLRVLRNETPDYFLADPITPNIAGPGDAAEGCSSLINTYLLLPFMNQLSLAQDRCANEASR
jgi:hypothetical protein